MPTPRQVYDAVEEEREYQDTRWNEDTTPSEGIHETGAFLTFMRLYLQRADELCSTIATGSVAPIGHPFEGESALDFVRKVTALGVACMEQNGAPKRFKRRASE